MRPLVLIVHNQLRDNPTEEERDVVTQAESVGASLRRLGWRVEILPLTLDLESGRKNILDKSPDCIFNLVESLNGDDRFIAAAPLLYESLDVPFTGSCAATIAATTNKCIAKKIMRAAGLSTPDWQWIVDDNFEPDFFPLIIKSSTAHASIGLSDDSVVSDIKAWRRWKDLHAAEQRSCLFAESYIHGREFNLSLLQRADGSTTVLPPAEISFKAFPEGKPHIVGYAAKWESSTFEYNNTPRIFSDDPKDALLHQKLVSIALSCWNIFSLSGYARVDFRVDMKGEIYVLEVNANPCLSPDGGFAAACMRNGIDFDCMVKEIVEAAMSVKGKYG